MRKRGRRLSERVHVLVHVSRAMLAESPAPNTVVRRAVTRRQGDTVTRWNFRTRKAERYVLLTALSGPEYFVGEVGDDFIRNRVTAQLRQPWELAFVSARRPEKVSGGRG